MGGTEPTSNALFCTFGDPSCDNLSLERSEDEETEFDYFLSQFMSTTFSDSRSRGTVDVDEAIAMAYKSIRNFEKIIHANAKSNLLNNLIQVSDGPFVVFR
jgi:hypothetical protein